MTKSNKYSICDSRESIPRNRKCECTNEAQALVVWAFSNFDRKLENNNFQKANYQFVMFFEGKSSQKHLGNIYKFFEKGIVSQE